MKNITKKRLDELILDEDKAYKEYLQIYKENLVNRAFKRMSNDEKRHRNYLKRLKKRLYK